MAQRVHVVLEDDIDGSTADETISFEFDGVAYEIDLNSANADKFKEAIAPWIGHARKRSKSARSRVARKDSVSPNEVREWARAQGMQVSDRGRVSATIREAYDNAH